MGLASRLAGFPLALATAGAYIGQSAGECSAREYLVLYDQQWHELRENADQLLEYEDRTLFSTWNLSLEQVRKQNSAAADLMSFLAYFGNSGLDYELFRNARDRGFEYRANWLEALTESKSVFNKAMAILRNYSLVEYSPQGYSLHTCVHDWTLQTLNENLEPERYWDAMLCVASNVTTPAHKTFSWQNQQRLIQHANQIWRVQLQQRFHADFLDEHQAYSLHWIGSLWEQQGNFDRAESLLPCALSAHERLFGSNDERTLIALAQVADLYKSMARFIDAEKMYRRALEGCKNNLLPVQDLRSRLQHNLALLYINQHKLLEAELLLRDALAQNRVALGIDDSRTMHTACTLASVLVLLEKVREAEILSQEAAEGLKKTLGIDHLTTLRAIDIRAGLHFDQKQWEQAEMLYKMVLEGRNKIYGSSYAQTLKTVRQLGGTYRRSNKLDELVELAKKWGSTEHTLYEDIRTLGRAALRMGDLSTARTAYANSVYLDSGDLTCPMSSWCDICQQQNDPGQCITVAMGHFICQSCDDVDLCRICHEKYQIGEESVAGCVGHDFFEVYSNLA
jgi:tetratricopeptide (TPR) repeat protein